MCPSATNLADVVMARCDQLAACSEAPGQITRRFLSAPMREVHQFLGDWMHQSQLATRIDNAGNIIGRLSAAAASQSLVIGSHLDTVPGAGRYDGVLGVLIGLAVAERLSGETLPFHLDVIGFSEEEGVRYNMPYLGSRAVTGTFRSEWLEYVDSEGIKLVEAIHAYSLDAARIEEAAYSPEQVIAFLEPHLEQGPVLERAGLPLGVVSAIVGQSRRQIEFHGVAGHAGTTPMQGRSDALVMAAEFVREVHSLAQQIAGLRATVGSLHVVGGAQNVIPGQVRLSLDVRHAEDAVRERAVLDLLAKCRRIAESHQGQVAVLGESSDVAVNLDDRLNQLLTESIAHCGYEPTSLVSGAGHDAVVMAQRFPTAMLFLRHPDGVSHHPDERVDRDDVAIAIEVLTDFVLRLASFEK